MWFRMYNVVNRNLLIGSFFVTKLISGKECLINTFVFPLKIPSFFTTVYIENFLIFMLKPEITCSYISKVFISSDSFFH